MKERSIQCYQREDWAAYHEDRLDEQVRLEMEEHLLACERCLQYYLESVESSLQEDEFQLSEDFSANLMTMIQRDRSSEPSQAITARSRHHDHKKQRMQLFAYYCAAAGIALFFWAGGYFEGLSDNISKGIDWVDKVQEPKITLSERSLIREGWTQKVLEQERTTILENLIPEKE